MAGRQTAGRRALLGVQIWPAALAREGSRATTTLAAGTTAGWLGGGQWGGGHCSVSDLAALSFFPCSRCTESSAAAPTAPLPARQAERLRHATRWLCQTAPAAMYPLLPLEAVYYEEGDGLE
ncbi:hypothetical protein GUJ93_ZPchr0013g34557 [Zizania palustris]|uniref:Uncharacterized protein n=1 Tax=Zizania palustris TaxID=103762 RepID=A0A8J6C0H5_ZIZPA|nr:hypothetical protein GUJ93_ZPchr0013g34557 [Zizania palustris]